MSTGVDTQSLTGPAAAVLAELGERAVLHDVYDEVGAAIYDDLSAADKHEVRELTQLLRRRRGPVLELAAGSGRLTLPMLALGNEVVALDLSAGMLGLLRARLATLPSRLAERCLIIEADMSDFALGRLFDAVVLGATSVTLLDERGRAALFRAVRAHLTDDGRFLVSTVDRTHDAADDTPQQLVGASGRGYRLVETWPPGAVTRTVVIVPDVPADAPVVDVCTSVVHVLESDALADEMARERLGREGVLLEVRVAS
jgi:SAM-dependent methyltransferase